MGEDDADKVLHPLFDELEVGEDEVDARIVGVGEGQPQVGHQPLAAAAIEVDVHADLARPAERKKQQLFAGSHRPDPAASKARPCMVRSGSMTSKASVCLSNSNASPPVAMTVTGRPISAFNLATSPSIIAT